MIKMISKELLSEILGIEVEQVKDMMDYKLYFNNIEHGDYINIYELAYKCKEWAKSINCDIVSGTSDYYCCYIAIVSMRHDNWNLFDYISKAETEPEAIFKACQWILDNKELE